MFGDENSRELLDKQFEAILTNGEYNFDKDTLRYTDIQGQNLKTRKAHWVIKKNVITIKEIDRPFERQAFVHFLSKDSLVISPIIDEDVGDSQIIFSKIY